MIGGEYFPNPEGTFFIAFDKAAAVHGEYRVAPREDRPGHFSGLAEMSGIFLREHASCIRMKRALPAGQPAGTVTIKEAIEE